MSNDTVSIIRDEINCLFSTTYDESKDIEELNDTIARLQRQVEARKTDMQREFVKLLCLVSVDVNINHGNFPKVPLIRVHRSFANCTLKESKCFVEAYVQPVIDDDIPF